MSAISPGSEVAKGLPKFGNKRDVARLLLLCPLSIDNLLQKGLPSVKLSSRKIIFDLAEVAAWAISRYGVARMGKEDGQ